MCQESTRQPLSAPSRALAKASRFGLKINNNLSPPQGRLRHLPYPRASSTRQSRRAREKRRVPLREARAPAHQGLLREDREERVITRRHQSWDSRGAVSEGKAETHLRRTPAEAPSAAGQSPPAPLRAEGPCSHRRQLRGKMPAAGQRCHCERLM